MPLPPQALKQLMDLSTGRLDPTSQAILSTPTPNLPPSLPTQELDRLGQPSSPGYPGYIGPFQNMSTKERLRIDDTNALTQDLIDNASPEDLNLAPNQRPSETKTRLEKELEPNTQGVFEKHSWIPGGRDETPDENA